MSFIVSSGHVFDSAESPIEQDVISDLARNWRVCFVRATFADFDKAIAEVTARVAGGIAVAGQVKIGRYRVDLLLGQPGNKVVIECDGHDFHRAEQWQIDRDAERDRHLRRQGVRVERLTGSQIFNHLSSEIARCLHAHGMTDENPQSVFRCQECVRLGFCPKDTYRTGRGCDEERLPARRASRVQQSETLRKAAANWGLS